MAAIRPGRVACGAELVERVPDRFRKAPRTRLRAILQPPATCADPANHAGIS